MNLNNNYYLIYLFNILSHQIIFELIMKIYNVNLEVIIYLIKEKNEFS